MNRRTFATAALASVVAGAAGVPLYARLVERHLVETKVIPLSLGLTQPLRIVVLGDFHFDPLYEEDYLADVTRSVTDLHPDLILYTGDFVTQDTSRMDDLAAILSRSVARYGSYAVLGNHDVAAGSSQVTSALERKGIRVLLNEFVPLPGQDHFLLVGLDSYWYGHPDLSVFSRMPEDSRHLVLLHEPDPFADLNDPRIKLQISGHTHGGQVRFPFVGAMYLPDGGRRYDLGMFTQDERLLYVNRGIGTKPPHYRFDCRPEITVFALT